VFVCGFSAGGHLAASAGILWNSPVLDEIAAGAPRDIVRPTGMILSYPVISSGEWGHKGSFLRLCGKEEPTEEELNAFSLEKHVTADTSPAFIWHTTADKTVPVQNSLMLAGALATESIPFELHVFPNGRHGLALCNELTSSGNPTLIDPHAAPWMDLAIRWASDFTL
jgi:acetyl esterase/lipase